MDEFLMNNAGLYSVCQFYQWMNLSEEAKAFLREIDARRASVGRERALFFSLQAEQSDDWASRLRTALQNGQKPSESFEEAHGLGVRHFHPAAASGGLSLGGESLSGAALSHGLGAAAAALEALSLVYGSDLRRDCLLVCRRGGRRRGSVRYSHREKFRPTRWRLSGTAEAAAAPSSSPMS